MYPLGLTNETAGRVCLAMSLVQVHRVLDVRGHLIRMRHDRRVVLERIADVAVLVGRRPGRAVVQLIGIVDVVVPLIAVVLPRDACGCSGCRRCSGSMEGGIVNGVLAGLLSM